MSKICTKPYPMPLLPGQTTPYICQPGTLVIIPALAIHKYASPDARKMLECINKVFRYRDEAIYPDPENFDPERFSETERKNRHKAAFLSAGEGPRMCLGIKFAYTQVKVALAQLVLDNEVLLESPKTGIVLDPSGMLYQSKENMMVKFIPIEQE